jgi:hypothetical protein
MSLKAFHVLFVVLSVGINVFFGVWTLALQPGGVEPVSSVWGYLALIAAAGLIVYGVMFLQKMKRENIK